eukprot:9700-Heterococcus_DN1.PRE.1
MAAVVTAEVVLAGGDAQGLGSWFTLHLCKRTVLTSSPAEGAVCSSSTMQWITINECACAFSTIEIPINECAWTMAHIQFTSVSTACLERCTLTELEEALSNITAATNSAVSYSAIQLSEHMTSSHLPEQHVIDDAHQCHTALMCTAAHCNAVSYSAVRL